MALSAAEPALVKPSRAIDAAAAAVLALLLPFLAHDLARVPRATPIDYVEGWNAFHTARVMRGEPLYRPVDGLPLAPVNYPPLSFLLVGRLAHPDALVLSGRVLALLALVAVTVLLYRSLRRWSASPSAAALGSLCWLGLLSRFGGAYVGSYDPQLLGHALCTAAIWLYASWEAEWTPVRAAVLAGLCSLALFVKALLLAVPAALAFALLWRRPRAALAFGAAGLLCCATLGLATWLYAGDALFANLGAFERPASGERLADEATALFVDARVGLLAVPVAGLAVLGGPGAGFGIAYVLAALLLGAGAVRGVGVDRNAWFDLFLAAAIVLGLLAERARRQGGTRRLVAGLALAAGIVPLASGLGGGLREALNYERLRREEAAYLADVGLLRSIPGPALFEEPLLGYDAGKELLFDPFTGSLGIVSGRVPEAVLVDPIRRRAFGAIVLTSAVETRMRRAPEARPREAPPRLNGWWTRGALEAIRENYDEHDPGRRRFGYFYLPKGRTGVAPTGAKGS
jgi:hypothetical protein